ncbi:hypothetical protein [Sphingobacterium lactis]|uniref:Uncharacterized protein n=1 Tax=Sphingobacterium lactis TaxID=797291 RepID=A0A1H5XIN2_9SPHI|nr:hypothetical protein [Sphingobacterium lactis]SEG11582.1 hypothetical protein SAMN05421877_10517 [Sphingobacterium lactis]
MESLKFEISAATKNQLLRVKEVLSETNNISEWQIAPYIDGYLVSIKGINIVCTNILQSISSAGVSAERLYEE